MSSWSYKCDAADCNDDAVVRFTVHWNRHSPKDDRWYACPGHWEWMKEWLREGVVKGGEKPDGMQEQLVY